MNAPADHKPTQDSPLAIVDFCQLTGKEEHVQCMAVDAIAGGGSGSVSSKQEAGLTAIN
jgi:hypothetical protein